MHFSMQELIGTGPERVNIQSARTATATFSKIHRSVLVFIGASRTFGLGTVEPVGTVQTKKSSLKRRAAKSKSNLRFPSDYPCIEKISPIVHYPAKNTCFRYGEAE